MTYTLEDRLNGEIHTLSEPMELDLSVVINLEHISKAIQNCYRNWENLRGRHWDAGALPKLAMEIF